MIGAIYVITDPAAPLSVVEQARAAAHGGAWAVQLRDKTSNDIALHGMAQQLRHELNGMGVKLIINDRIDVALSAGADGVHIGQGDGDPRKVRDQIGPHLLLGLSIETLAQAHLVPTGIDYIGAGPVRATTTKPDHAAPIGMVGLAKIAAAVRVPTIAIGGLGLSDVALLKQAGAAGMAVVTAISLAQDPEAATRTLLSRWMQL